MQGARIFRQPAGFAAVAHLVANRVMTPKWDGCRPPEKDKDVWFLDVLSVFGRKLSNFMPESCRRLLRGARSCCLPYRPEKSDVLFGPLGLLFTISGNVDKAQPAKNSHFYMGYLWPSRVPTENWNRNACLVQANVLASCTSAVVCFDWPW